MSPFVSIVMPAYNADRTLPAAIQSVLEQTWKHWELLVILDRNSTDSSLVIAQDLAARDERIRVIADLPSGGCTFNRNHGLKQAKGDYIAFLDSDDLWLPTKLEKQIHFMQENSLPISCTGYRLMDWQGASLSTVITPPRRIDYQLLLNDNCMGCLTVMFKRDQFPGVQFVDHLHEDYILWLRLLKETDAGGLPEPLAVYRMAPNSRSGNKVHAAYARWRILRKFERLPLWRALPCFARYAFTALGRRAAA